MKNPAAFLVLSFALLSLTSSAHAADEWKQALTCKSFYPLTDYSHRVEISEATDDAGVERTATFEIGPSLRGAMTLPGHCRLKEDTDYQDKPATFLYCETDEKVKDTAIPLARIQIATTLYKNFTNKLRLSAKLYLDPSITSDDPQYDFSCRF